MSTILFGYSPDFSPLLDALMADRSARPLYLMPGDGRKGSAVRSVPIHPHQVNEMTDFALTHQADLILILDRACLLSGAADDARAMGIRCLGPTQSEMSAATLKKLRLFFSENGLPVTPGKAYGGARAAAEKHALWPARLLAPDGQEYLFQTAGALKNALNRRELPSPGGEWIAAELSPGPVRTLTVYRDENKSIPFPKEEGDEKWTGCLTRFLDAAGYSGFMTLRLRLEEDWVLDGFSPLPAPDIPWADALKRIL